MNSYAYSILQYVPDPVRGERVNVGVLVAAEDGAYFGSRLLPKSAFGRVKRFGFVEDVSFLTDIKVHLALEHVDQAQLPGTESTWTVDTLRAASHEWANTLQLSTPRPAMHTDPAQLLAKLFETLVADPAPKRTRARDRRAVNERIGRQLRHALRTKFPNVEANQHIRRDVTYAGQFQRHRFDFELRNGRPLDLVSSISFETRDGRGLQNEVDAVAWAIDDVAKSGASPPITVVSVGAGKHVDVAEGVYTGLGANFVREAGLGSWLDGASSRLMLAMSADGRPN